MLCIYPTHSYGLENNSFEQHEEFWQKNNSSIEFNIHNDSAKEGSVSAVIKNDSSTSYGIEQILFNIIPESDYQISSFIKINNPPPSKAFLRIAWYESTDASGSQIETNDSEIIVSETDWRQVSFYAKSPTNAHSAKIRLLVSSGTAYFDAITIEELLSTPTPVFTPTYLPTPTIQNSIHNIFISEAMVYPNTNDNEWVELYNNNDYPVTLIDWFIDDTAEGGASPKKITVTLLPHEYVSIDLTSSVFNNSGDDVRLLYANGEVADSFSYEDSVKDTSIGTNNSNSFCTQKPSKNKANYSCLDLEATPTITKFLSPTQIATVLGIKTITSISAQPSPQITLEKKVIKTISKPKHILNTQAPPAVITTKNYIDTSTNKKPWLLISSAYSLLAGISLVSKIVFFRYT